jgi:hypothetical protein
MRFLIAIYIGLRGKSGLDPGPERRPPFSQCPAHECPNESHCRRRNLDLENQEVFFIQFLVAPYNLHPPTFPFHILFVIAPSQGWLAENQLCLLQHVLARMVKLIDLRQKSSLHCRNRVFALCQVCQLGTDELSSFIQPVENQIVFCLEIAEKCSSRNSNRIGNIVRSNGIKTAFAKQFHTRCNQVGFDRLTPNLSFPSAGFNSSFTHGICPVFLFNTNRSGGLANNLALWHRPVKFARKLRFTALSRGSPALIFRKN